MNTKRWIAIMVAGAVFICSILFTITLNLIKNNFSKDVKSTNYFSEMFEDTINEEIVEEGDKQKRIVVLDIIGEISESDSAYLPSAYSHEAIFSRLESIKKDDTIKGVILNIDSPGGSVYESAKLRKEILDLKKTKKIPIYVVMNSLAASGGYYISADADKIYAAEDTWTGSIGVIMSGLNYSGLMKKYGVEDYTIKSGEFKDMGSSTKPVEEKDKKLYQEMVDSAYNRFVEIVAKGRNMEIEKVKSIADGRVYDGVKAKEVGLVDEIGYIEDSYANMKKEYKLKDAEIFKYQEDMMDIFKLLNNSAKTLFGKKSTLAKGNNLPSYLKNSESPKMMYLYGNE